MLAQDKAIQGASRLALAAMLTRKLTLRHSAESDSIHASEAALDVSKILPNWGADERATLLERPLFGFASYGRVRFHHRSVVEFLAAKRLDALLARGVSIKAIKRLLFTETAQGARTVRPSMRPVAAWLALSRDTVFDDIVVIDPAVVLDHGDPQSLSPAQRLRALECSRRSLWWRGMARIEHPTHPGASVRFAGTQRRREAVVAQGIENRRSADPCRSMHRRWKLTRCADIAHKVAKDSDRAFGERSFALGALLQLNDPHLEAIAVSLETDAVRWPDAMARHALESTCSPGTYQSPAC